MARALAELVLLGALAGTVGVLVLLRRLAFVTDALTHTVFPGVVIGFLLAGEGGVFWGALAAGALTAVLLTLLTRHGARSPRTPPWRSCSPPSSRSASCWSRGESGYTADLTAFLFGRILTVTGPSSSPRPLVVTAAGRAPCWRCCGARCSLRAFDPGGARAAGYRIGLLDLATNAARRARGRRRGTRRGHRTGHRAAHRARRGGPGALRPARRHRPARRRCSARWRAGRALPSASTPPYTTGCGSPPAARSSSSWSPSTWARSPPARHCARCGGPLRGRTRHERASQSTQRVCDHLPDEGGHMSERSERVSQHSVPAITSPTKEGT